MGRTGPAVTAQVLTTYRKASNSPRSGALADLTARELDVLTLTPRVAPTPRSPTNYPSRASPSRATLAVSSSNLICATALRRSSTPYDNGGVAPR
jgi:hypothetical protein